MKNNEIKRAYQLLYDHFGSQHWWPGESPFEVMVGAILTQNTNWANVEKAITNLKSKRCLTPKAINEIDPHRLATLIRPAGYYNLKSKRLKSFVRQFIDEFGGDHRHLAKLSTDEAREWLLNVNGIGPETADSILLYALDKPIFVVDAYTKRIFDRHGFVPEEVSYSELQDLFMDNLEVDLKIFNEYHALIVQVGKDYCKRTPRCEECPLNGFNDRP